MRCSRTLVPKFCKSMAPSFALPGRCKTSVLVPPLPICPPLLCSFFNSAAVPGNFSNHLFPSQSRLCGVLRCPPLWEYIRISFFKDWLSCWDQDISLTIMIWYSKRGYDYPANWWCSYRHFIVLMAIWLAKGLIMMIMMVMIATDQLVMARPKRPCASK